MYQYIRTRVQYSYSTCTHTYQYSVLYSVPAYLYWYTCMEYVLVRTGTYLYCTHTSTVSSVRARIALRAFQVCNSTRTVLTCTVQVVVRGTGGSVVRVQVLYRYFLYRKYGTHTRYLISHYTTCTGTYVQYRYSYRIHVRYKVQSAHGYIPVRVPGGVRRSLYITFIIDKGVK